MPRHLLQRAFEQVCLSLLLACGLAFAQIPGRDPKNTLIAAAAVNGLHGEAVKPWRLKLSYKFLNPSRQPTEQGTIEELWIDKDIHKLTITESSTEFVLLQNQKGTDREGELDRKRALLVQLANLFLNPMPFSEKRLASLKLVEHTRPLGSAQLRCFTVISPGVFTDPAFCLDGDSSILRSTSLVNNWHEFTFNHVGKFQNRFVPIDVTAGEGAQPDLSAHVDSLQQVPTINPADFQPGPNAVRRTPPTSTIVIPEDALDSMIDHRDKLFPISRPQPSYPDSARASNVHGIVKMQAVIDPDGRISALQVIQGPQELREAALDAVWKWTFEKPFDNRGPAQVITVISVRL